jgi:hypothetical protein
MSPLAARREAGPAVEGKPLVLTLMALTISCLTSGNRREEQRCRKRDRGLGNHVLSSTVASACERMCGPDRRGAGGLGDGDRDRVLAFRGGKAVQIIPSSRRIEMVPKDAAGGLTGIANRRGRLMPQRRDCEAHSPWQTSPCRGSHHHRTGRWCRMCSCLGT